ncbi:hypothetical protein ABPG72_001394 [Tetrahymena utriculariae]
MNFKQQSEGDDGLNLDGESFFIKLMSEFKKTIFNYVYHLLNGERVGFFQRIMLLIIETFQILNFQFCYELSSLWKNKSIVNGIRLVLKITSVYQYFDGNSSSQYSTYKGLFFALSSIFLFLCLIFIYVIISLKRKNTHISFLINILRFSTELLVTVLFLPLIQLFLSPLNCQNGIVDSNQVYVMVNFPTIQCFGSDQIALVFLGIVCSILLSVYVGLMTLLFFGCRINAQDCFTKNSGRGEFCFFILKLILALFYNFLMNKGYDIVFIVIMLIGSFLLFDHYQFNLTYHDFYISKLITAQHAINLWTTLMLILAKITENYQFDGSSIIWIIGIPFVYIIILMRTEQRYDILLINTNQYDILSDPLKQLPYITKLLGRYTKDKHIQIMLDGFLDHHRNTCIQEDCPSKRRLAKTTKFSKALRNEKVSEQLIMVFTVIQSMYYFALQKFPNNTKIRIMYALYLVDVMRSSQQALQELLNTESERPVFDEEFIIFRYKQVIENDLMENSTTLAGQKDQSGSSDVVNELSVQNHERLCRVNIEKSTALHIEFWSQLSEDNPDLGKLSELGFKITIANQNAEDQWNRLDRINTYIPSLMRIYAKFLSDIIHDKDGAFTILKRLVDINFKNQNSNKISNFLDLSTDSRPSIVISAEDDSFGLVANINLAAASLSGYNKMEILNRNVSALMPQMYARYHDQFLESYLATLEPRILNVERILSMKSKQGYISPLIVLVRHVPSLIHGLQFVSTFRINKNLKEVCQLIVNKDGNIDNIGSSCINILRIDIKKLNKKDIPITSIIPSYWDNLKGFQDKHGAIVTVIQSTRAKKEFYAKITAQEIVFRTYGSQGYLLRIEKIKEGETDIKIQEHNKLKNTCNNELSVLGQNSVLQQAKKSKIKKVTINQHLIVRFDSYTLTYVGENLVGPPLQVNEEENANETQSNIFSTLSAVRYNDKDEIQNDEEDLQKNGNQAENKPLVNYGIGIRTVRLLNNQYVDIEELRQKEEEAEEDMEQEQLEEEEEEKNYNKYRQEDQFSAVQQDSNDSGNVFKKKHSFVRFIEESRFLHSSSLEKVKLFALGFVVLCSTFVAVNHILISQQLNEVNERVLVYTKTTMFAADGQREVTKSLMVHMYNKKILTSVIPSQILSDMNQTAYEMKQVNDYIELSSLSLSSQHQNFLNNEKVTLYDISSSQQQTLKLANQQILAKINNLVGDTTFQSYYFTDTDFFFLVYNLMNDYFQFLTIQSNYYLQELNDWGSSQQNQFILFLILSIVWSLLCFIGLLPFYILVNNSQQQILTMFLDIPIARVKKLFQKCENFLACLQGSNEDDASSTFSEMQEDEDQSLTGTNLRRRSKKRRNFRINLKNKQNFFLPFILIIIVFEGYFSYTYILSTNDAQNIQTFLNELNVTSTFEQFYGYSLNSLQLMLINSTFQVNSSSSEQYVNWAINQMYNLNNQLQKEHQENMNIHQSSYNQAFNMIFMEDSCQTLSSLTLLDQLQCEQFAQSNIRQGLSLSLSKHIENFISVFNQYQANQSSPQNNQKLLQSNETQMIQTMQDIYIRVMMRYLVQQFGDSIQQMYDKSQTIRITLLILAIIIILLLYISILVPILNTISREIVRVRSMIFMIPLDIIASVKSIKEIFQPFLSQLYTKE